MALFKNLLDQAKRLTGTGEHPRPVIRTVNDPAERKPRAEPEPAAPPKPASSFDTTQPDYNADALSLEGEAVPDVDPYATNSWEKELEADSRRLKKSQIGDQPTSGDPDNPYNSATPRRGWKS